MTNRRSFRFSCLLLSLSIACCLFSGAIVTAQRRTPKPATGPRTATPKPSATFAFNVRVFGATGDGKTLDTPAINKTIDAASVTGGGTVFFPAGSYLSVTIRLKSNVALYLDQGATIVAASPGPGVQYDPSAT